MKEYLYCRSSENEWGKNRGSNAHRLIVLHGRFCFSSFFVPGK